MPWVECNATPLEITEGKLKLILSDIEYYTAKIKEYELKAIEYTNAIKKLSVGDTNGHKNNL